MFKDGNGEQKSFYDLADDFRQMLIKPNFKSKNFADADIYKFFSRNKVQSAQ